MPSQTFQLARPDCATGRVAVANVDTLPPQYTRDPKLPSYLRPRDSVSVAMHNYDEKHVCCTEAVQEAQDSQSSMIPQALLVDSAASLCGYLYFTTLQARMALQQQSSLDLLSTLCSSLPEDVDTSLLHTCAHAISHEAESLIAGQSSYSHRLAIAVVLLKAFLGYMLLTRASRYVKPFDFLVASGAIHCLALYLIVFVPVASLIHGTGMTNGSIWLRVMTKVLWLVAICCTVAVVQWFFRIEKRPGSIRLSEDPEDEMLESDGEKSAISFA